MRKIIVLTGIAGSGKTEIARYIEREYGYMRIPFSKPIKDMLHSLGLSSGDVSGSLKEVPCMRLCGATPRKAMQKLGDWGRELNPDFWAMLWRNDVTFYSSNVIVDDCRYANEVAMAKSIGYATVFRIVRPTAGAAGGIEGHSSERQDFPVEYVLKNNGTVQDAADYIMSLLS